MIGLLIVSHSADAASGIREIALEMGGGDATISAVGGDPDGGIGTSVTDIVDAMEALAVDTDGIVVLVDLGSAVMNAESAVEMADVDVEVVLADAPILEGALNAAVSATSEKATVESVRKAAEDARNHDKL